MLHRNYYENNGCRAESVESTGLNGRNENIQSPKQGQRNQKARASRHHRKVMSGIAGLTIACLLLGGCGAGAATASALANSASESESASTTAETTSAVTTNTISTDTLALTSNSTDTSMTPEEIYASYVNAVVAISNEATTTNAFGQTSETASSGSGFIVSSDGYIVTNNHVVADADTLTVMLTNGDEYDATVIGADEENDVALIKIDATNLPTVSIGDSDNLDVGEQVCAIGNPLGELTNTLTVGYVSALDRDISESTGDVINMFQTDCAINAGNSGGPLFDSNGNVVGITTAKYSSSGSSSSASIEGIGFCIPINDAMSIVNDLMQYGYVKDRAYLGVSCQTISDSVTQYYNLPAGVYINSVTDGSAAANAGMQEGDIITAIGDTTIESVTDLKVALKDYKAGDAVTITVYRSGASVNLDVTLDEEPAATETSAETSTDSSASQDASGSYSYSSPFGSMFGFGSGSTESGTTGEATSF